MSKTKNVSISFTVTPDIKDQLTSHAQAACTSRSKTIASIVSEYLGKNNEPVTEPASAVLESRVRQIEIEKIIALVETYEYFSGNDITPWTHCDLNEEEFWDDQQNDHFDTSELPRIMSFLRLADEVNSIIWQIDNTFQLVTITGWENGVTNAIEKLDQYGLIAPYNVSPCNARELWDFSQKLDWGDSIAAIVCGAVAKQRLDIVAAALPYKQPIERGTYWKDFYAGQLATEGIKDVWGWSGNPEAHGICDELSEVLTWERPGHQVEMVLKALHRNLDPFQSGEPQTVTVRNADGEVYSTVGFPNFSTFGTYSHWSDSSKTEARAKFRAWHSEKAATIDPDFLRDIYRVVFGCSSEVIEKILTPVLSGEWWVVLGLDKTTCSLTELKTAYRNLAKFYHTDVNKSELAQRAIRAINNAKEAGEKAIRARGTNAYARTRT